MKTEKFDAVIGVASILFILACAGVFTASLKYLFTPNTITVQVPATTVYKTDQRCILWCQNQGAGK